MTAPQLSLQLRTFSEEAPTDGWRSLVDAARAADTAGIDRVVVSDHVVMGENLDAYGDPARGGTRGGRQPTGPDGHWLDPLAVLAHLAAVTERVRLGTNILIAALRRPVVLAGQASTIDVLSGGRLDLGVGVGWQAEEYEAAGMARMRAAVAEHGRDPADLGVVGTLRVPKTDDGAADPETAMAGVGALVEAGVTDVRLGIAIPDDPAMATDLLGRAVASFRAATS